MWPLNYLACETQICRRMVFTYFWSSYRDNHASMAKCPSSVSPGKFPWTDRGLLSFLQGFVTGKKSLQFCTKSPLLSQMARCCLQGSQWFDFTV